MFAPRHLPEFESTADSIVCTLFPTDDGWRFHVQLPRRVSRSDRRKVLEWLHNYSAEVRRQKPLWSARLTQSQQDLTLDLLSADDPRQAIANAIKRSHKVGYGGSDYASF